MSRERSTSRRVLLWAPLAAISIAVCAATGAERSPAAQRPTVRLRVEWSAQEPGVWSGRLKINSGRFTDPQSLSDGADDAGTISAAETTVAVDRRSARHSDAFEISVSARPDARLSFELDDTAGANPPVRALASLADCLVKPRSLGGEAGAPHVTIHRAPGDALGVRFDRPHLVFAPGETLRAAVLLNLVDLREPVPKPVKATLKWKLIPAAQTRALTDGALPVAAVLNAAEPAQTTIELAAPNEEGAYNLRLSATGRGFGDVERTVQLVVVDPRRPAPPAEAAAPKLVDSFEPATGGLLRKVAIVPARSSREGFLPRWLNWKRSRDEPAGEDESSAGLAAAAYKLHAAHPGRPHLLELAITPEPDDELFVSILQPDGQGKFLPAGIDTVVPSSPLSDTNEISKNSGRGSGERRIYRQIFWPNDRETGVCIVSSHAGRSVPLERVQVYELGERLPASDGPFGTAVKPREPGLAEAQRFVGQYLHSPIIARNLFGPAAHDAGARSNIDDWRTFLVAARRLAEYLHYRNQSGLMLAVVAEGAAIYPSDFLLGSLRYDNGKLASTGQDPLPKDVLELLLRIFDREALVLLPELQFDAPLESLERVLREEPAANDDLKLTAADGGRWDEASGAAGNFPGYNVLSPRVQQAVVEIVEELVGRYAVHPSFGGVAFELGPASCLQYPGIEWGYDAATIGRFEQATRIRVPRRDAFRFLTTTARRDWLRFRCAEVAQFHRRLASLVTAARPGAKVIFSSHVTPGGDTGSESSAIELVRSGGGPAQLLAVQGLDFSQAAYASDSRVSILRPVVHDRTAGRLEQGALATLNNSPGLDGLYRASMPGALIYSKAPRDRASGTVAIARSFEKLTPGTSPAAPEDSPLQPFAHALATLDARVLVEGQDALYLSPADPRSELPLAIGRLPDVAFRPAGPQVQPVAVRSARVGNSTYLYAVNDSPLPLSLALALDCPAAGTTCRRLASGQPVSLLPSAGGTTSGLEIELAPFELFECRFGRPGVGVVDVRVSLAEEPLAEVKERIERLSRRMNAAALAGVASKALKNAGFEEPSSRAEPLPGWELPVRNTGWSLDDDNPHSGEKSLRLSAADGEARLASPELSIDGSRFVAVSVWMRSNKGSARVEIALDAQVGQRPFLRQEMVMVGKTWSQYRFRVEDFPAGEIKHARVFVRPIDSCKLWIDDAEIEAQSFSTDELRQLTKTLSSAKLAFEEGRYADCERLLDGYWGRLLSEEASPTQAPVARERPRMSERVKNLFRK